MPSFLENLKNARNESATAYHLFLLKYPKPGIYAFFEGEGDSSFYSQPIRRFNTHSLQIYQFDGTGKRDVLSTYQKVAQKASLASGNGNTRLLFFVDRDYDELLGKGVTEASNLFVTRFYSVENYLVSDSVLQVVFEDLFNFSNVHFDFELIREKFQTELTRFYELMQPITAFIVYLKKTGVEIDLKRIKLSNLLKFNEDINVEYIETDLQSIINKVCFSLGLQPQADAVANCELLASELRQYEPKVITRGKFELWFFVSFVRNLAESLKKDVLSDDQNLKKQVDLGLGNALHILGPRVPTPIELSEFLELNLF